MGVEGLGASSGSLAMPSTRKKVRPKGNVGSLPNSPSTSNLTCFYLAFSSVGMGCHLDMPISWICRVLVVGWGIYRVVELLVGRIGLWGGLGKGYWCQLGHWGEGLSCHLDLSLPLEWECLLNPDHPAGVSSFSHLAESIPQGQAEGEQTCEAEQLWEHLLPLAVHLASLDLPSRPALAMHLATSLCIPLMHSSCCLWGSMLGTTAYSPL